MNPKHSIWFRTASWLCRPRVRRTIALTLFGGAAAAGLAALPFGLLTAQQITPDSARSQVLQLLTDLHSSQPGAAANAEEQLSMLGVSNEQLQYARLLKHPDRFERFRLVSLLPQIAEPLQTELRVELTRDHDREVRSSVINLTKTDDVRGPLAERLDEMRRLEPDARVRQRVEQLLMSRPQGTRRAPATLNVSNARPVRPDDSPVTREPIEIHAALHRPVDGTRLHSAISHLPPGPAASPSAPPLPVRPETIRQAAAINVPQVDPFATPTALPTHQFPTHQAGVISLPMPGAEQQTTATPIASAGPVLSVSPLPPSPAVATQPANARLLNEYQRNDAPGASYAGRYGSRPAASVRPPRMLSGAVTQFPDSASAIPLPEPTSRFPTPAAQDVAPLGLPVTMVPPVAGPAGVAPAVLPFGQSTYGDPVRTIRPTLYENVGIPPAPDVAPPPPAEILPTLQPQRFPAAGIEPLFPERNRLAVPAQAPAAEIESSEIPEVRVSVPATPQEPRPLLPGAPFLSGDRLFQSAPTNGPVSSDDVGGRRLLDRPIDQIIQPTPPPLALMSEQMLTPEPDAPFGFTGPSGIIPKETQTSPHFVPVPDRWRLGYEHQDRYGLDWPWTTDYLGNPGHWWDPYNQNVLKGDYPLIGQHTFLNVVATSQTTFDYRQTPIGTTPFESTRGPNQEEFFGQPESTNLNQNFFFRFDLLHSNNAAFKPLDWQFRITPTVNINEFHAEELAVINPDVRQGRNRIRDHFVLQEYFAEFKIADLSPDYDFVSMRAGNQLFNSDFRGFIFFDTNRAVRLFGSRFSNRHQFNLLFYDNVEKDTNSGLNTTKDRHQNVLIANYYVQDFVWPGYTFQTSFHYNNDQPSTEFDRNNFLVRPDPVGVFQPHRVEAYYFGIAGDGHIGRINVNNAFYWVTGRDGLNPIAGRPQDINACMGALELSYDRDWARFRASLFFSSGDDNPNDTDAEGFDSIIDNPVFVGGEFSYWQRQAIQLFGVRLVNDRSLVPDLRSSGIQGQSNFVNPGIFMFNLGLDMDITPKLRSITNANYIMFDETEVLSTYTFQGDIDNEVGLDISTGFEWRPFHNDNAIVLFGVSALLPDEGFKDLYNEFGGDVETFFAAFADVILTF